MSIFSYFSTLLSLLKVYYHSGSEHLLEILFFTLAPQYGFVYLQFSSKPVHAAEPESASSLLYLYSDTWLYRSRLKLLVGPVAPCRNKLRMGFCSSQGYPIIRRYSRKYPPEYIFESHFKLCLLWL